MALYLLQFDVHSIPQHNTALPFQSVSNIPSSSDKDVVIFNAKNTSQYDDFSSFCTAYPFPYVMKHNTIVSVNVTTREQAYQASKATNYKDELYVLQSSSPEEAKRRGTSIVLDPDWNKKKRSIMYKFCVDQVLLYPSLQKLLLSTGDSRIVDSREKHNDPYWAAFVHIVPKLNNVYLQPKIQLDGENWHGKIWMIIRDHWRTLSI